MGTDTKRAARQRSDLSRIKAWWRTLGGDRFAVLPPPNRSRYTQSDGHEDAAEMFAVRGISTDASFAYWHWQSHDAFDRDGDLTGELYLHWGGDHATVTAGLGDGPDGYRIVNGGPQGAFRLDRVTAVDGDGLPDPEDAMPACASSSPASTPRACGPPRPWSTRRRPPPRSAGSTTACGTSSPANAPPRKAGTPPPRTPQTPRPPPPHPRKSPPPPTSPPPTSPPPPASSPRWSTGRR